MKKIIGINSSPRLKGQASKLLDISLKAASLQGVKTEKIDLYLYRIEPCIGCVSRDQQLCRFPCVIKDEANKIMDKILESDGMIISTPVYWYSPPGHLKNLIDRMTALENMIEIEGRSLLEGKVVGVIAVGNDSGAYSAASQIASILVTMGAAVPPWGIAFYARPEPADSNKSILEDAANVGRVVAKMVNMLQKIEWYDPDILNSIF